MKAIIFDIDNTLIELRDEFVSSMKDVLMEMNYNFSDAKINEIYKYADEHEKHFSKLNKQELLDYINEKCNLNLPFEFLEK